MIIKVLVEISHKKIDKTFYYLVPNDLCNKIKIGIRVLVPFASMKLEGFVLEIVNDYDDEYELKEICGVIDDEPILNDELLELGKYISKKTISTLISSYQVMLPRALKARMKNQINIKMAYYVTLNSVMKYDDLSDKQMIIINELKRIGKGLYSDLKKISSSIDTLIKKGIVIKSYEEVYRLNNEYFGSIVKKTLTNEQKNVSNIIIDSLNQYERFLLHGITGSGKTEVYMEIIDEVLKNNRSALLLLPEISLTPQIVDRFKKRFPKGIAILHSGLSEGEKYDEYRKIVKGDISIVIGARSAIFAPLNNLGVIIIDECHSSTYKQDIMPKYDTIDIANWRGNYHQIPIVLGSATPSLDIYARSLRGIYKLLELKNRIGSSTLPEISIVDMTKSKRIEKTNISYELYEKIKERLLRKEQIILLLNRRGYTNLIGCNDCGYIFKCKNCDISLTYHKSKELLRCHYCGYAINYPNVCPNCHGSHIYDLGLGTERIEEEITNLFPDVKLVRMDFDTTSKKGSHEKIIKDFGEEKYQILLGTQMIAKGLDFLNVTLVGVINIDNSLAIPSYKSAENTFSLLTQVAGRSGRGTKPGMVIIQSYNSDHYAIKHACKNDYIGFYQEEMLIRKNNGYPPYYFLANIIVKSKDYNLLSIETNRILKILNQNLPDCIVMGPTPTYPFKINGLCRFSIIIKYKKEDLYCTLEIINEHYRNNDKIMLEFSFNPDNL